MKISEGAISYGKEKITFTVVYIARKTLEIAVHPDRSVVVKAPLQTVFQEVVRRVVRRAKWIRRQLNYFRQFDIKTPSRKYVGGETHHYLGRQYRLKFGRGNSDSVKLVHSHFRIETKQAASSEKAKALLASWYLGKAVERFEESLNRCWPKFEKLSFKRPKLQIRRMQKRWGSLSKNGTLTINVDLIRAPKECIDYVVTHELSHLKVNDHSKAFYGFLGRIMPDWEKRKHKLEMALI